MGKKAVILSEYEENFPLSERLQVPSNERLFKGRFCSGSKRIFTERNLTSITKGDTSVMIMLCLEKKGYYFIEDFDYKIKEDMYKLFRKKINNTCGKHRLHNLEYHGLVEIFDTNKVRLTVEGRSLLVQIKSDKGSDIECAKIILSAALKVRAKGFSTKMVSDNVKSFVYRIIFYFVLKHGYVTGEFLTYQFPYITNATILETNPDLNIDLLPSGPFYTKWVEWGIQLFINIGIIKVNFKKVYGDIDDKKFNARISAIENDETLNTKTKTAYINYLKKWYFSEFYLSPEYKKEVDHYFGHLSVHDLFYGDENYRAGFEAGTKIKYRRDPKAVAIAKERDDYTCQLTGIQEDYPGSDGNPYCEGHHIFRMVLRDYFLEEFGVDIDSPEFIVSVLTSIHKKLTIAPIEHKKYLLDELYDNCLSEERKVQFNNMTREDFYLSYKAKDSQDYRYLLNKKNRGDYNV